MHTVINILAHQPNATQNEVFETLARGRDVVIERIVSQGQVFNGAMPPQSSLSDDELVSIITLGRGMMPAFGERIPPEGVRGLVAHLPLGDASHALARHLLQSGAGNPSQ